MSRKVHRYATVAAYLLVAVALTGACGTFAPEGATLGPTFTAATLATPTSERIAAPPTAAPPPSPEIDFPLALGNTWVFQLTRYEGDPTSAIITTTSVVTETVVEVDNFLEEAWAGTAFETWFCPGVGVVDRKSDHHGTPGGFREVLIRYQVGSDG